MKLGKEAFALGFFYNKIYFQLELFRISLLIRPIFSSLFFMLINSDQWKQIKFIFYSTPKLFTSVVSKVLSSFHRKKNFEFRSSHAYEFQYLRTCCILWIRKSNAISLCNENHCTWTISCWFSKLYACIHVYVLWK